MTIQRLTRGIEMWVTVAWSWLALRCWPERELAHSLAAGDGDRSVDAAFVAAFHRNTRAIAQGRCLLLSVALLRCLRRRRMNAELRIGFELGGSTLPGHAWVACADDPSTSDIHRFQAFHCTAAGLAAFLAGRRAMNTSGGSLGH